MTILLGLFLACFIQAAPAVSAETETADAEQDSLDELKELMFDKKEEDYADNRERMKYLERQLTRYQRENKTLSGDQKYLVGRIGDTLSQLNTVNEELDALLAEKEEINRSLESANNELNSLRASFNAKLRSWYIDGMGGYMTLLPAEGDDIDLLTRMYYTENLLEKDRQLLRKVLDAKENIQRITAQHDEKIAQIASRQTEYIGLEQDYKRQKQEIANRISTNEWRRRKAAEELELLEKQGKQIEEFLKSLEEGDMPDIAFNGVFTVPLSKADYAVSGHFGWREVHPVHGRPAMHYGIDLGADKGSPVHAAGSGVVKQIQYLRTGYGTNILVLHDRTYSTLYAHLSEVLIREGDPVTEGQVIGRVGSTGTAKGNHLHFEIRVGGVAKDPRNFLKF